MATYRNKFFDPLDPKRGPEIFETEVRPTKYKGFKIYHRHRSVFDCVLDGAQGPEVIGMYAGMNGAKNFIDEFWQRQTAE